MERHILDIRLLKSSLVHALIRCIGVGPVVGWIAEVTLIRFEVLYHVDGRPITQLLFELWKRCADGV